jgi:MFS family permease
MKYSFGRFIVDMSVNASVAGLGVLMLPMAIGALANHGVGAEFLGLVAFLELGFAAATALLSGWGLRRIDPISMCILGGLLSAAGNLASAFVSTHVPALLVLRAIAGAGTGLMSAGGLAFVARLPKAERMYGYIGMAPCLSALLGFSLAPYLISWTDGAGGIFGFEAVLGALNALLMYRRKPLMIQFSADENQLARQSGTEVAPQGQTGKVSLSAVGAGTYAAGLISTFFLSFCDASIWDFVAPVGQAIGIPLEKMGNILMVGAIVGCGGPLLAARMGARFGMLAPIAVGQSLMIALSLFMVSTHDPWLYSLALYARVFTILFLQPMYQGLFARVDPVGRVVAASSGAGNIGYSVGPLIAGLFISTQLHAYHNLGTIATIAASLSFLMTLPIFRHQKLSSGLGSLVPADSPD